MTCSEVYQKDPEAVLDYIFDWSDWLEVGEVITTASITAPTGITVSSQAFTSTQVTAWVTGGVVNVSYRIECKITTNLLRTDVRGVMLRVTDRWC